MRHCEHCDKELIDDEPYYTYDWSNSYSPEERNLYYLCQECHDEEQTERIPYIIRHRILDTGDSDDNYDA